MSKFYEIDAQNKFKMQSVPDKDTYAHTQADVSRLIYSEADERLCIGTLNSWIIVATPYDILDQNTKVLFGSYPLPTGWNLDATFNDRAVLLTNSASTIGDETGEWTITGMSETGDHKHTMSSASSYSEHRSTGSAYLASYYHTHKTYTDGDHVHSMSSSWRPYHKKYCIAEYILI